MIDTTKTQTNQSGLIEAALLGGILLSPDLLAEIPGLEPKHLADSRHKDILEAILALAADNSGIDILLVANHLKADKKPADSDYLSQIVGEIPTISNTQDYALAVLEAHKRRFIAANQSDPDKIVAEMTAADDLVRTIRTRQAETIRSWSGAIKAGVADLEARKASDQLAGISSGYADLDDLTGGWRPGDLIVIGARPGVGKTALSLNLALAAASDHKTLIFSLEMATGQLIDRLLALSANINSWHIRTGKISQADLDKVKSAADDLAQLQLVVDDRGALTIPQMRFRLAEHTPDLVIVDYLQLMRAARPTDNRVAEISEISRGLKLLAREFKCPVIATCQLNREIEKRDNKTPILADLRDSGSIEQDADMVGFLYPTTKEVTDGRSIRLDIQKHRHGATGKLDFVFRDQTQQFLLVSKETIDTGRLN